MKERLEILEKVCEGFVRHIPADPGGADPKERFQCFCTFVAYSPGALLEHWNHRSGLATHVAAYVTENFYWELAQNWSRWGFLLKDWGVNCLVLSFWNELRLQEQEAITGREILAWENWLEELKAVRKKEASGRKAAASLETLKAFLGETSYSPVSFTAEGCIKPPFWTRKLIHLWLRDSRQFREIQELEEARWDRWWTTTQDAIRAWTLEICPRCGDLLNYPFYCPCEEIIDFSEFTREYGGILVEGD